MPVDYTSKSGAEFNRVGNVYCRIGATAVSMFKTFTENVATVNF